MRRFSISSHHCNLLKFDNIGPKHMLESELKKHALFEILQASFMRIFKELHSFIWQVPQIMDEKGETPHQGPWRAQLEFEPATVLVFLHLSI